jgi:hypothetical protein
MLMNIAHCCGPGLVPLQHVLANINRGGCKLDKANLKMKSNVAHLFITKVLDENSPERLGDDKDVLVSFDQCMSIVKGVG